jgi:hypothetical protein
MACPLICCQRLQVSAGLHGERRLASGSCLASTRPRNLADGQYWPVQARGSARSCSANHLTTLRAEPNSAGVEGSGNQRLMSGCLEAVEVEPVY